MKVDLNLTLQSDLSLSEPGQAVIGAPFLSIITRTQGRRPHTLIEVLTCLAAQTDSDFEILLLGHRLDYDRLKLVLELVEDCPLTVRERIRFIPVSDGNRTRPLQVGLAAARGDFVALLDDDDIIFAHWVESFRTLARAMPGRVLRSNTVVQIVDTVSIQGLPGFRAEASPELRYPKTFSFFEHILENRSPPMMLAFPRQLIEDQAIGFDETLTTTEDWDFLMRCAAISGVADAGTVTSVYRWWNKGECSRSVHAEAEWKENHRQIWKNWDAAGLRLPPGSMQELVGILREHAAFSAERPRLACDHGQRLETARLNIDGILNSTCWRVTRPLRRMIFAVTGAHEVDRAWLQTATVEQAEALVLKLYRSRSWRLAAPVRVCRRMIDMFRRKRVAAQ